MNDKVVTRFAPSPTGYLHVGGIRTALYAWLWTRKNNGKFILRIEDTDKEREVIGSIDHIKESLTWLGLNWDEYYVQSERLDVYKTYAQKLIDKGLAFTDPYSEEELEQFRKKAEEEKRPFLYRNHRPENPPKWDGSKPLRFKISNIKKYEWKDVVWGDLSAGEEALDDYIIIKSDGYPTYNFAHIVDDIEMEVTHVMRGQEFISSTPKFLALYEALEIKPPQFVTLPPVMGPDGKKKLSKRDGAKDILDYRKEGYLPDAMINFLAFLGWNPGGEKEIYTREELINAFEISNIQHSGARLNVEKLDWTNKEHIKLLPKKVVEDEIKNRLNILDENKLEKISGIILDRINKWGDIDILSREGEFSYFFQDPIYESTLLSWKGKSLDEAKEHLIWVKNTLENTEEIKFGSVNSIKAIIFDYATEKGRGDVLWPLRASLSGKEKSPDPFTLLYVLGKNESLKRINKAISLI